MKKITLISFLSALVLGVATSPAMAQTYSGIPTVGTCTTITSTLSKGSRGSDVLTLQSFLVNQNYAGGGSWMVTGYFGDATKVAVQNFQGAQGLPSTGIVDAATRDAISRVSCGGVSYLPTPTLPTPYFPIQYPQYPYNPGYNNPQYFPACGTTNFPCATVPIALYSVAPNAGAVGSNVTIYGQGFSTTGNTVRFGTGIITNLSSPDGRSISFTIPANLTGYGSQVVSIGSYDVSVSNSSGQVSNLLSFYVSSLGTASQPVINSISGPTSLAVGVQGTWNVSFYNPSSQYASVSIRWGDEYLYQYSQAQAAQSIYGAGSQQTSFSHIYPQAGTYTITVTVTNSNGVSNTMSTTVNVGNSTGTGSVYLNSLSPTSGSLGTLVILTGSGFTADNTIRFGAGGVQHAYSANGNQLYFTIPSYISACDVQTSGYCNFNPVRVVPGSYTIYVTNANGTTQGLSFTVTN